MVVRPHALTHRVCSDASHNRLNALISSPSLVSAYFRLMSSVHAIIVALGGAIALCIPEVHKDMLESWHPMVGVLAAIFLGYCALDTYLTLYYHDKVRPVVLVGVCVRCICFLCALVMTRSVGRRRV